MTKFLLTDWEINGYSDSDFMCSYYNSVSNIIGFYKYGTTRFPSATNIVIHTDGTTSVVVDGDILMMPTVEVVEKARLVLADRIFEKLKSANKRQVDEPNVEELHVGLKVRLLEKARMQLRSSSACSQCNGTGKWTNPRKENDKRDCFACNGSGKHIGAKTKDENGKQIYKELPFGLVGEVIDWCSFGQFYSSGYSKPNRNNTSISFQNNDGEVFRASLVKLRLDQDYKDDSYFQGKADELSYNYEFSALYPRFAWDTHNFAKEVAKAAPIHAE